jgi:hypothetical protein
VVAFLFVAGSAAASPQYAPMGNAFTFQGSLTDGGIPANGTYDLKFRLYDDVSAGSQQGPGVPKDDVTVTDGSFTVMLDFGSIFNGTAMYLEIDVRAGSSTGAYTTLTPRQPLTATPYALFAMNAMNASVAPWGGLTGVPAGFADGVDDTGAGGASYQGVVIVAKSGGDFSTITAALNSITASDSNRYLIYVAPGVYTEQVTMEPYVDIQGSGELNTKITFTGSAEFSTAFTLSGANDAELRFLTVENTGGDAELAMAIYNGSSAPRLSHVTARALDAIAAFGVYNYTSSPTMTDVTASASGSSVNHGVYNAASSPTMTNVTASALGGDSNYGVYNYTSSPTMTDVTASASGGTNSYGVYNETSVLTMTNVTASASGGASNYGVYNIGSLVLPNHVQVNNSQITGSTTTIFSDNSSLTRVGASQLSGGPISGFTVVCAGVYDENYTFYASTCP